jgi:electron transfer flavoprotein-quinone oxidoreductase
LTSLRWIVSNNQKGNIDPFLGSFSFILPKKGGAMDKTTCIVVGAGGAGSACAYSLAQKGIETVLLERGTTPGEKNVAAFIMYIEVLKHLIPDCLDDAPFDRNIVRTDQVILGPNHTKTIQSYNYEWLEDPIAFSAFRRKFDAWLANKARDAGAQLITGQTVTDLIMDADRIVGVKVGDEELYADVVVGCEGFLTIVGEKAGLVKEWPPERCMLGVKQVLDLPEETINERFQLNEGTGCEIGVYLHDYKGLSAAAGTIYTNTDAVSVTLLARVDELKQKNIKLHEHLEMIKQEPYYRNLLKGASLREYACHILSDGGRVEPNNLYGNGVLLCGEAGGIEQTHSGMGVPVAMLSGMMAAETIADAVKKKDFSRNTLKNYLHYLGSTSLMKILKQSRKTSDYFVGRGKQELAPQLEAAAEIYDQYWESDFRYISRSTFSLVNELYMRIGKYSVPKILHWAIVAILKLISLPGSLIEKFRRTIRSRYYEWKK